VTGFVWRVYSQPVNIERFSPLATLGVAQVRGLMPWLNHPKFIKVREKTLTAISREEYRFRHLKRVIFLCGGRQSRGRERVREYLLQKDLLVFYAEDVWSAIAQLEKLSALEMEARLAELADLVIIIVESPGTFAELVVACKNKRYMLRLPNESSGGQDFTQRRRDRGAE